MAKVVACKRCGKEGLAWSRSIATSKWTLLEENSNQHRCEGAESKTVVCKDCGANDLHWFKNTMEDGTERFALTESFGLPHACDERRKKLDDAKQAKKDLYNKEKDRVMADPTIPAAAKKAILHNLRRDIWPNMFRDGRGYR